MLDAGAIATETWTADCSVTRSTASELVGSWAEAYIELPTYNTTVTSEDYPESDWFQVVVEARWANGSTALQGWTSFLVNT